MDFLQILTRSWQLDNSGRINDYRAERMKGGWIAIALRSETPLGKYAIPLDL